MKNRNALIIIAKTPRGDSVKTRLNGFMTEEKRIKLYEYLLQTTINKLSAIRGVDTWIAYPPLNDDDYFSQFRTGLLPLPEGDLGERMYHAFSMVFDKGYQKAVLVGVDIPELSESVILHAFELLSKSDIAFGPARDGGYYLVGMNTLINEIFELIQWSTAQTLKQSIERAQKFGYSVAFTETLSDIDTAEDVKRAGFEF